LTWICVEENWNFGKKQAEFVDGPDKNLSAEASSASAGHSPEFPTTHWSVVRKAGEISQTDVRAALERLCQDYWRPVYAFIRRSGTKPEEAEDLTQSFFAHLLENETFKRADRAKGRFRSFLLGSLNFYLSNERAAQQAQKRGGRRQILSLDDTEMEAIYVPELAHSVTPDKIFAREWAKTLVKLAQKRLEEECANKGDARLMAVLASGLSGEIASGAYAEWASSLGLKEGAVRVALHRLRRRYGELLRSEVAQTVSSPEEVDEEIRQIFAAILIAQ
jgi:RNA polymerase sigma-70 factor (ECF subfamily)